MGSEVTHLFIFYIPLLFVVVQRNPVGCLYSQSGICRLHLHGTRISCTLVVLVHGEG